MCLVLLNTARAAWFKLSFIFGKSKHDQKQTLDERRAMGAVTHRLGGWESTDLEKKKNTQQEKRVSHKPRGNHLHGELSFFAVSEDPCARLFLVEADQPRCGNDRR